jgi:hypothetical protein
MMSHPPLAARSTPIALLTVLLVAACGGTARPEASSADAGAASPAASSAASPAPASDPAPPASAGAGSAGSGTASDACDLLSDADLAELTTWTADAVEPGPQQGVFSNGCLWTLSGGTSPAFYGPATISLGIVVPGGRSYYDTYFAPFAEEYDQEPLVGVGDEGLVDSFTNSVLAVQDDAFVSIQWLDIGSENQAEVAIALTERVLSNLGDD